MRPIMALVVAAVVALAFASSDASARQGLRGGGFHGGGFHGGFGGFRGGAGFRGPVFHGRFVHGPRFRHFRPAFVFAAPLAYGLYPSYYPDDDPCLLPRRVWTNYGWQISWINVCY